tara:strand:+ start:3631 stop:4317 length:687 start_codon:yes stop_codon:yes gene_type:complete
MFELNKEFDITLVSGIGVEDRNILIIDDFYKNPDEVRQYCIDSPLNTDPNLVAKFPGARVWEQDPRVRRKLEPQFAHWRDQKHLWKSRNNVHSYYWNLNWDEQQFMCNVTDGPQLALHDCIPHQDYSPQCPNTHACVIYLNTPEECQGGTSFYSYEGFCSIDIPHIPLDLPLNELQVWAKKNFKVESDIEMKYNRCVMYETDVFHSQSWYVEGQYTQGYNRMNQILFM